jgi:hypothetical protein
VSGAHEVELSERHGLFGRVLEVHGLQLLQRDLLALQAAVPWRDPPATSIIVIVISVINIAGTVIITIIVITTTTTIIIIIITRGAGSGVIAVVTSDEGIRGEVEDQYRGGDGDKDCMLRVLRII